MFSDEKIEGSTLAKNINCFAVSCAYAKKLGATIELHTDNLGKKLLGFLPYDAIHTTLEGLAIEGDFDNNFWTAGKIETLKNMQLGDVHIDGDFFVKTPETLAMLFNFDGDVLFQCSEKAVFPVIILIYS